MKCRLVGAQVALSTLFSLTLALGSAKADPVNHRTLELTEEVTNQGHHFGHDFGHVRLTELDDRLFSGNGHHFDHDFGLVRIAELDDRLSPGNGHHFGHDFGLVRITELDDRLFSGNWEHRHAFRGFSFRHRHMWLVAPAFRVPSSISGAVPNPEPATMLLFGTGLLAVGWTIRKKRRSTRSTR